MILLKDADKYRDWTLRIKAKVRALRPEPQVFSAEEVVSGTANTFADNVEIEKVDPGTFYQCPEYGPGTELHRMLSRWFDTTDGCGCDMYACKMNLWGYAGCRERIEQITERLVGEATKRKLPMATNPMCYWVARKLATRAIDKAERNQLDGTVPLLLGHAVWKKIPWLDNKQVVNRMDALEIKQIISQREEIATWLFDAVKSQGMCLTYKCALELIDAAVKSYTSRRATS